MRSTLVLLVGLLSGCASISEVSQFTNDKEGYTVKRVMTKYCGPGVVSPSMCIATLEDSRKLNGITTKSMLGIVNASTSGYLPSLIGGSAAVGSAHLLSRGLKQSGSGDTNVEIEANSGSLSNVGPSTITGSQSTGP